MQTLKLFCTSPASDHEQILDYMPLERMQELKRKELGLEVLCLRMAHTNNDVETECIYLQIEHQV